MNAYYTVNDIDKTKKCPGVLISSY